MDQRPPEVSQGATIMSKYVVERWEKKRRVVCVLRRERWQAVRNRLM